MIMKKNYFKPEMAFMSVELCNMIATSPGGNTNIGGGQAGSGDPEEARGSRGEWGNVWGN